MGELHTNLHFTVLVEVSMGDSGCFVFFVNVLYILPISQIAYIRSFKIVGCACLHVTTFSSAAVTLLSLGYTS